MCAELEDAITMETDYSGPIVKRSVASYTHCRGFPGGSVVNNPQSVQETQERWVQSLGQEDPLEEGMATHARPLSWRIQWTEEPSMLQSIGSQRVSHD